jgi:hypothetical protein
MTRSRDGSLLPWQIIPPWLRVARVLFFIAAAAAGAMLITSFFIQGGTLTSPEVPSGPFRHPEEIKGATRYLTDQLDLVYRTTNTLIPITWGVAAILGVPNVIFEQRIRNRLWRDQLEGIANRMAANNGEYE